MNSPFRYLFLVLTLSGMATLSALAQSAPVKQIPAGSTATIGPAQGTAPTTTKPNTPQGKILNSALGPETRHTLQEAMDSAATK
jgi:hypothetical protein